MKRLVFTIVLAAVLWTVMFSPLTAPYINFWWMMTASATILAVLSWLFDFARPQVNAIYGMKEGESPWLLSVLMLFLIGPAEEIFWRGYVQRTLSGRFSRNAGFVITTLLYAAVHAGSCNFMLVMAALVAGVVWGGLYRFFPERFSAVIISHALWDAAVFVWFPI